MIVSSEFHEVTLFHLEKLRRHLDHQPEILLEQEGSGSVPPSWNIFADLIGMDDQLEGTWQLDRPTDRLLVPVPVKVGSWLSEADAPLAPSFRSATYLPGSTYVRLDVSMEFVQEYGLNLHLSDFTSNVATMCLIRYRRQPLK